MMPLRNGSEVGNGSRIQEVLVAAKRGSVAIEVAPAVQCAEAPLVGRLVAAVPGYALVVVGSSRENDALGIARGADCRLRCTVAAVPYEFECVVLDARRTVVSGSAAWALRTSFPSSLIVRQRRTKPRASVEHQGCAVFLSDYFGRAHPVRGRAINVSVGGILADFPAPPSGGTTLLTVGRSARVVFDLPASGVASEQRIADLESYLMTTDADRSARAIRTESGHAILDLPARVVRIEPGRVGGEAAAFEFQEVPPAAADELSQFVLARVPSVATE